MVMSWWCHGDVMVMSWPGAGDAGVAGDCPAAVSHDGGSSLTWDVAGKNPRTQWIYSGFIVIYWDDDVFIVHL